MWPLAGRKPNVFFINSHERIEDAVPDRTRERSSRLLVRDAFRVDVTVFLRYRSNFRSSFRFTLRSIYVPSAINITSIIIIIILRRLRLELLLSWSPSSPSSSLPNTALLVSSQDGMIHLCRPDMHMALRWSVSILNLSVCNR